MKDQEFKDVLKQNELKTKMGTYCRNYRMTELDMTLDELAKVSNANPKNISAFEHGRSSNIWYFYIYLVAIDNVDDQLKFVEGLEL